MSYRIPDALIGEAIQGDVGRLLPLDGFAALAMTLVHNSTS